jgi:hypothetical protein
MEVFTITRLGSRFPNQERQKLTVSRLSDSSIPAPLLQLRADSKERIMSEPQWNWVLEESIPSSLDAGHRTIDQLLNALTTMGMGWTRFLSRPNGH